MEFREGDIETHRDEIRSLDDDAHISGGSLPVLLWAVDMPAPVHPQVRKQNQIAREVDTQPFAGRLY
jgi:hypothetical protein